MELLKFVMLAGIATLCCGQSGMDPMDDPIMPVPTPIRVNATRFYRGAEFYQQVYNVTTGRSAYLDAARYRYSRYNCHVRDANGTITNRVPSQYVLTIFLQMPVLHFLELRYKIPLMEAIRLRMDIGPDAARSEDLNEFMAPPEICIDGYDQAFVGSFEEGIMLRIYRQPPSDMFPESDGSDLERRFVNNDGGTQIASFEGMPAVDYRSDSRAAVIGPTWPGRVSINLGGCRQLDYRTSFFNGVQLTPEQLVCRSLDTDEQNDFRDELAENPDPINFYLEAGDYVFAVLGSIVVAIVLGLAILGYFIHPFFLA